MGQVIDLVTRAPMIIDLAARRAEPEAPPVADPAEVARLQQAAHTALMVAKAARPGLTPAQKLEYRLLILSASPPHPSPWAEAFFRHKADQAALSMSAPILATRPSAHRQKLDGPPLPSSPPHSWGGGPPSSAVEGSLTSHPKRSARLPLTILIIIAALLAASPAWLWA